MAALKSITGHVIYNSNYTYKFQLKTTKVLTTQVQDTKAKMIICSNHSRKVVFETLKNLELLGKVKVIVLELAQPKPDQDIPIDVSEKDFVFYKDFLKWEGQIQPPSLQNGPLKDEEVFIFSGLLELLEIPKARRYY